MNNQKHEEADQGAEIQITDIEQKLEKNQNTEAKDKGIKPLRRHYI